MTRSQAVAAVRALLNAGLTLREVAERLGAHPKAVEALIAR
jgi:DNA-binding CsgD family transcriptional regulator